MTWFKVDDSFYRSAKVRKLGLSRISVQGRVAGVGLWALAGDWSADNMTDGFVPWEVVEGWDPDRRIAVRLIASRLWFEAEQDGERGIQFHDWSDWQPTRDQVVQRRKVDAERRARWRETRRSNAVTPESDEGASRKASRRDSHRDETRDETGDSHRESRMGSVLPDPTRPDPTRSTSSGDVENEGSPSAAGANLEPRQRGPRGTRIPDDFEVTPSMVTWAKEHAPHANGRVETDQFRDYWHAKAGKDATKIDWEATWRSWMRNAEKHAGRTNGVARNGEQRIPTTTARVAAIEALRHAPPEALS